MVLGFLGSPANARLERRLTECLRLQSFHEDRLVFYEVLTAPPADPAPYLNLRTGGNVDFSPTMTARSAAPSAPNVPRTMVLDPMLRAVGGIAWERADGHARPCATYSRACQGFKIRRRAAERARADRATGVRLSALRRAGPVYEGSAARIPAFCSTWRARIAEWWITGSAADDLAVCASAIA